MGLSLLLFFKVIFYIGGVCSAWIVCHKKAGFFFLSAGYYVYDFIQIWCTFSNCFKRNVKQCAALDKYKARLSFNIFFPDGINKRFVLYKSTQRRYIYWQKVTVDIQMTKDSVLVTKMLKVAHDHMSRKFHHLISVNYVLNIFKQCSYFNFVEYDYFEQKLLVLIRFILKICHL